MKMGQGMLGIGCAVGEGGEETFPYHFSLCLYYIRDTSY